VWYSLGHDERSRLDLQKVIAQDRPTLIFEKYSSFQTGCARAASAQAIPYVVQFHAPAEESPHYHVSRRSAALLKARMATAGRMATAVVAVSPYMCDYLMQLGVPGDRILTLPNGVDLELVAKAGSGASVRRKLGTPSDALVIGFVGTMRPWQGYEILPEVFARVKTQVRNAVFLLVGPFPDNPEKEKFEKQLVRCGVRKDFVLTAAVPAYLKAMDIGVMPDSTDYCSPMKLFEYGACARAVVMPRRAAILRVIRDGDNGLLFHPSSPQDMAEKITYLANRPGLRDSLGARLAQEVRSKYTYVRNVERILEHLGPCMPAEARSFHVTPAALRAPCCPGVPELQ
jgi:glycosyltransferase involved in cell wall biosynthesis